MLFIMYKCRNQRLYILIFLKCLAFKNHSQNLYLSGLRFHPKTHHEKITNEGQRFKRGYKKDNTEYETEKVLVGKDDLCNGIGQKLLEINVFK